MGDRYGETESRVLSRECDVVSVPWGRHETLPEGSYALITQRLGSSITVMSGGNLYRIAERDADDRLLDHVQAGAVEAGHVRRDDRADDEAAGNQRRALEDGDRVTGRR